MYSDMPNKEFPSPCLSQNDIDRAFSRGYIGGIGLEKSAKILARADVYRPAINDIAEIVNVVIERGTYYRRCRWEDLVLSYFIGKMILATCEAELRIPVSQILYLLSFVACGTIYAERLATLGELHEERERTFSRASKAGKVLPKKKNKPLLIKMVDEYLRGGVKHAVLLIEAKKATGYRKSTVTSMIRERKKLVQDH